MGALISGDLGRATKKEKRESELTTFFIPRSGLF